MNANKPNCSVYNLIKLMLFTLRENSLTPATLKKPARETKGKRLVYINNVREEMRESIHRPQDAVSFIFSASEFIFPHPVAKSTTIKAWRSEPHFYRHFCLLPHHIHSSPRDTSLFWVRSGVAVYNIDLIKHPAVCTIFIQMMHFIKLHTTWQCMVWIIYVNRIEDRIMFTLVHQN